MSLCPKRVADTDGTPRDADRRTPVCAREAFFQHPVGWGRLVGSTNWCATCDHSFRPSTCSVQPHIFPSTLPTTSSLQFLPHLLLLSFCLLPVILVTFFPQPSPWLPFATSFIPGTKFVSHPLLCFPHVPFCPACLHQVCFSP